jgi:hypothetical protein
MDVRMLREDRVREDEERGLAGGESNGAGGSHGRLIFGPVSSLLRAGSPASRVSSGPDEVFRSSSMT